VSLFRDQLIASLPKMNGIRHLRSDWNCFHDHDLPLIASAMRINTSLHNISTGINTVVASFYDDTRCNRYLTHLENILGLVIVVSTTTTAATDASESQATTTPRPNASSTISIAASAAGTAAATTIILLGLWTRVLNVVGQEGDSPVFMILQSRLATWPVHVVFSNVKKRKRRDDDDDSQQQP
jgi:hypothetical protein